MKSQNLFKAYESPRAVAVELSSMGVLCSSVEQTFSSGSIESFTKDDFNW